MTLAKTLLASAAVCALCTAPALAREAPPIHLASMDSALTLKMGSPAHFKTNVVASKLPDDTESVTFTGTLPAKRVPTLLWGETWYDSENCTAPANEKGIFPKTTALAKITHGTSTGTISSCGSTIFTYYGPVYDLKMKGKSDTFASAIKAYKFVGYNLTLNVTTDLHK
jgi:hypothetical protein